MRRFLILLTFIAALGSFAVAQAYWSGLDSTATGTGGAAYVNRGSTPSVSISGATGIALSWGPSSLRNDLPVDGYTIKRYDADSGVESTVGSGCTGLNPSRTCTETGVPNGEWRYSVTPVFATNWQGEESARSGSVGIGSASINLNDTVFGLPQPGNTTGSLAGFTPDDDVIYTLDGGTAITGSPTSVDSEGNASITSLEIPTVPDGPHTIHVRDASNTHQASIGILVDTTPPTVTAFITPAANAAGWNRATVILDASSDDGTGSGVDYLKGTGDGSDPRTSPTAVVWDGIPVPIPDSADVRYIAVDLAGNASEIGVLPIKIDTIPPVMAASLADVTGGVFIFRAPPALPRLYYRGVEAGSYRFQMDVTDPVSTDPLSGTPSGPAWFGTSDLYSSPTGFTHVSSIVTEPEGGPYLSNPISWVAGTTSTPTGQLTISDIAGNITAFPGALENDSTAPIGGTVDATGLGGTGGRFSTSKTLNLALGTPTDPDSGLQETGARLLRATATLIPGTGFNPATCGVYGVFSQVGPDDPGATVTDTVPEDHACYRYRYSVSDHVGNIAQLTSPDIMVAEAPPESLRPYNVGITPVSGLSSQSVSGTSVFYRSSQAGSFTVEASSSGTFSGTAHVDFPPLGGFTGGGSVTTASGDVYRSTYGWSDNGLSPSPGLQAISATNEAGSTLSNDSAFTVTADDDPPTGGSVDATGLTGTGSRYSTSTSLSIALDPGTDSGSGPVGSGRTLSRASASLTSDGTANGSCGNFGPFTLVSTGPASPLPDTVPADGTCYRYEYQVADAVGNRATFTSPDIKVDSSPPPAPVLTFSNLVNASSSGSTVYYRPASSSGSFTLTAASADMSSGNAVFNFPTLPTGWSSTSGGPGVRTYSWSGFNPAAPAGGLAVSTSNNAGSQSSSPFAVTSTSDASPPSGGSITYPAGTSNGYNTGTFISITFSKGTDTGSGLASSSGIIERSSAPLSNGVCGTYGAYTAVASNPTSVYQSNVPESGCYRYRYLISDNVGNQAVYTGATITKFDQQGPTNNITITNSTGAYSVFGGAVLYYKGNAAGTFRYLNAVTDAASGPAGSTYPSLGTSGWSHTTQTVTTPVGGPYLSSTYSWTANPGTPASMTISGRDGANRTSSRVVGFTNDSAAPTGGAVNYPNGTITTLSVAVSGFDGNDPLSGIKAPGKFVRDETSLNLGTGVCGSFPGTFPTTVTLVGGEDTSVASGRCYKYRYLISDNVGNQATYTSTNVVKLDSSPG